MDSELKCNRLTCRQALTEKAVVTTCSHIFCVDCANELFTAARLCPACDTALREPDDVVVSSLHPSNDYKTSVLSGLSPGTVLEICSRAMSFWQYQISQENSFQHAVVRNLNEKNTQLQKQLENTIREANSEMALLNDKANQLECDLETERRRTRELQEESREREKEYQKQKVNPRVSPLLFSVTRAYRLPQALLDKFKRKALLAPGGPHPTAADAEAAGLAGHPGEQHRRLSIPGQMVLQTTGLNSSHNADAQGFRRTPLTNRSQFAPQTNNWNNQQPQSLAINNRSNRRPFNASGRNSGYTSADNSESADEVENLLMDHRNVRTSTAQSGWSTAAPRQGNRVPASMQAFTPQTATRMTKFRPAPGPHPNH